MAQPINPWVSDRPFHPACQHLPTTITISAIALKVEMAIALTDNHEP